MNLRLFVYIIVNIIVFVGLGYLGYTNYIAFLTHNPNINHTELFYIILTVATLSMLTGIYLSKCTTIKLVKQINEYKRELERRGIDRDENSSKVRVLESKIEVLEKALKDAIKNKNN